MSMDDPREELEEVLDAVAEGELPRGAAEWAESALETAESILMTVEEMRANDRDAPTEGQARALENIYKAATRWLRRGR